MKLPLVGLLLTLVCCISAFAQTSDINIIPKPQLVESGTGQFALTANTQIVARDRNDKAAAAKVLGVEGAKLG
jgi:hypothetical protein